MKKKILAAILISFMFISSGSEMLRQQTAEATQTIKTKHVELLQMLMTQNKKEKLHKVIKYIETKVHRTPYVFSGSSIYGWDCSGLVRYAYQRIGITLPHSADKQGHLSGRVSNPQLGDIVVFAYPNQTRFYHSGIYLHDGLVLNANSYFGTTIIEPLANYKGKQIRFIRILGGN